MNAAERDEAAAFIVWAEARDEAERLRAALRQIADLPASSGHLARAVADAALRVEGKTT